VNDVAFAVDRSLSSLPTWDHDGNAHTIIETPKGSRNKLAYDHGMGTFVLSKVLPVGMRFPFDFGFLPGTHAEDGDPLDVLVLMDEPVFPGCVVATRLLGVIEAQQRDDGVWVRNDRLIGVAAESTTHAEVKRLSDVDTTVLSEIEAFFTDYDRIQGHRFRAIGRSGPGTARRIVGNSIEEPGD
jgi:inorganic pyrophosphatase